MRARLATCIVTAASACAAVAFAQTPTTAPSTHSAAAVAAQTPASAAQGVPLSALQAQAPEHYTVQRGDTLWHIANLFLRQPWQWPQLWRMNRDAIANPHWIYPGQVLYLEKANGYARLSASRAGEMPTVKLSPQIRSESLSDMALPTVQMHVIEAFLAEPLVVPEDVLQHAPRIIAGTGERILLTQGDQAYALGPAAAPLVYGANSPASLRIFRQATPLRDPISQTVLGYEAQYLGRAQLQSSEVRSPVAGTDSAGKPASTDRPAVISITRALEEIRLGDRLLPEPERQYLNFVPHAAEQPLLAHVVSLYGSSAKRYATPYQVIAINKGLQDGVRPGLVLALLTQGRAWVDKTDPQRPTLQLPAQDNGTAMVFRSFERVSYALIMDAQRTVHVGDSLVGAQ